jgi:chromosome segregation ATPase
MSTATLAPTRSSADWTTILDGFTAKLKAIDTEASRAQAEKESLVLSATLGDTGATKKIAKLSGQLARLVGEREDVQMAMTAAHAERRKAEAAEAMAAETTRLAQAREAAQEFQRQAGMVDEALKLAAERFDAAHSALARLESFLKPDERSRLLQLHSRFAATNALAAHRLTAWIDAGPSKSLYPQHHLPFAEAVMPFIGGWLRKDQ